MLPIIPLTQLQTGQRGFAANLAHGSNCSKPTSGGERDLLSRTKPPLDILLRNIFRASEEYKQDRNLMQESYLNRGHKRALVWNRRKNRQPGIFTESLVPETGAKFPKPADYYPAYLLTILRKEQPVLNAKRFLKVLFPPGDICRL